MESRSAAGLVTAIRRGPALLLLQLSGTKTDEQRYAVEKEV
jgi:hypothetical protein